MTKARNLSLLSTVEVGATADQTKSDIDALGIAADIVAGDTAARAGRKNFIINGGFDVWQRGAYTSATGVANDTYYVDRFFTLISIVTATLQNTANSAKVAATSSATGFIGLSQKVEDKVYNTLKGKTVTLSAKVTSNNSNARLRCFNGSAWESSATSHSGNGTEETLTHTFTVSSSPSDLIIQLITYDGNSVALASGDYIEVTGVQLELGSVATDFEHRSYGEELALCQRYYQQYGTGIANTALFSGTNWPGNNIYGVIQWKQPMRAAPTVTFSSQTAWIVLTTGAVGATTYIAANTANQYSAELNITANIAITAGYSGWIRHQASSYMYVSAEL
jgi:hypothetical protein